MTTDGTVPVDPLPAWSSWCCICGHACESGCDDGSQRPLCLYCFRTASVALMVRGDAVAVQFDTEWIKGLMARYRGGQGFPFRLTGRVRFERVEPNGVRVVSIP